MIKRVNFTGRKKIAHSHLRVDVIDAAAAGEPRRFEAEVELASLGLMPTACVVVEALCAGDSNVLRFDFGTVAQIGPPPNRTLAGLTGEHVYFNLKVIDRSERVGRLVGLAEGVRPERGGAQTAVGRQGLLPVERKDLGDELWRLDYGDRYVTLLVNDRVPDFARQLASDPRLHALVYPQVVRDILTCAIFDKDSDLEGDDWFDAWPRFGVALHPLNTRPPDPEDKLEAREWIEEVVRAFCKQHAMRGRFETAIGQGSDA